MAENCSKSKLRRKKSSVAEYQPEISSRETAKKSRPTLPLAEFTADTEGSVPPAAVWWNREQLPAVENLYALTLKSALLHLENQHWDLVPDLPVPSTASATPQQLDDHQWCDLNEEVAPFPEPTPPSPKCPPSPDPLSLNSTQQTRTVADTLLSSYSKQRRDDEMTPMQTLTKRRRTSLHSWQGESSLAGPSCVEGEEGRKAREHEKEEREKRETGPIDKQPQTEDVQMSGRRDEGVAAGRLQTCPMCLLMFPAGFTQMDCDSHLAQCLSEMNVDVTW